VETDPTPAPNKERLSSPWLMSTDTDRNRFKARGFQALLKGMEAFSEEESIPPIGLSNPQGHISYGTRRGNARMKGYLWIKRNERN
jgi:hypothetical protein